MKKGERRKRDLLQIAYGMFVSKGYENTSVDEIIEAAGIAKGTYYYYFQSKEQMLEEVIGMMLEAEAEKAEAVLRADLSVPEKIVGIIASIQPEQQERTIDEALHRPENLLMHDKIRGRLFDCDHIPERIRMILILSSDLFDGHNPYTPAVIDVFIEATEKILGAKPGTMGFVRALVRPPQDMQ